MDGAGSGYLGDAESAKEAQLLESWKAYKKGFHEGVALFNEKPKKGVAFMQVHPFMFMLHKHLQCYACLYVGRGQI